MSDLFKKLNVLLKASLNDIVSGEESRPRLRLGKNVDGEIAALRDRINDAVSYEDEIKARIRQFDDEAARWDRQADDAVTRGDDAAARYAVEQMRRAEQRAALTGSDLREHQRVTQDLIERVNMLESAVADARRAESQPTQPEAVNAAPEKVPLARTPLPDLSSVLRDAREKITALGETAATKQELNPPAAQAAASSSEEAVAIDDDLEQRRQRLSKR